MAIAGATVLYAEEPDSVNLLVGRSTVINVGTPISRVSLTSPDVADALVTSSAQLLLHGKTPGTISMFVWDRAGAIKRYDVVVQRDLSRLSSQVLELFPGEQISVQGNGKSVIVSGTASSKYIADKALEVAAGYVEKKDDVVNLVQVQTRGTNQVLLKVRFAEVSRSALTELGASIFTGPEGYKDYVARATTQQFPSVNYTDRLGPSSDPTRLGRWCSAISSTCFSSTRSTTWARWSRRCRAAVSSKAWPSRTWLRKVVKRPAFSPAEKFPFLSPRARAATWRSPSCGRNSVFG